MQVYQLNKATEGIHLRISSTGLIQARSNVKSIGRTIKLENILTSVSGAYNVVGTRGPLKGPWWGPGAKPPAGSRGQSPRKLGDFGNLEGSREALMAHILQCFSSTY